MKAFLILRLDGPMQAWGTHTFEDYRPVNPFPTRSGLLGLIGACLGIDRRDAAGQRALADSLALTVRVDREASRLELERERPAAHKTALKASDYHTVLDARKVDGSTNRYPIVSQREYLFDAVFTVAVGNRPDPPIALDVVAEALRRPLFTPTLGRRSCPLCRPLLNSPALIEAADAKAALANVEPGGGLIYAEDDLVSAKPLLLRDVPSHNGKRQFGTRRVYLHKEDPSCS
jgi:CRISPR system Cascade subunit CasD